jgi:septum formation topological specificity factor MinE
MLVVGFVLILGITSIYQIGYSNPLKNDFHAYTAFEENVRKSTPAASAIQQDEAELTKWATHADKTDLLNMLREREELLAFVFAKQREFKPQTKKVTAMHNKLLKVIDTNLAMTRETINLLETDALTREKADEIKTREREIKQLAMEYSKEMTGLAASYGRF